MRVILRENIENLGKKGDIVNVASGFGRNYLIPKKIAIEVTSRNKKMIAIEQKALQKGFEREKASYQELIDRLDTVTLSFTRKTSEKDVIFGSVSSTDIRDALIAQGFDVEKKRILLDEPIKRLGNYTVPIKIFHEDRAEVKLEVVKEGEPVVQEDTELSPESIEEDLIASEAVEKEELPSPDMKEEGAPLAEEPAQDVPVDLEAEPESTADSKETEEEKETADEPSLEETKEAPLEADEEPMESQKTETGESGEESGEISEEEISKEAVKAPEDAPEDPEEKKESPEDTSSAAPGTGEKTEEEDRKEEKNKDTK